MTLNDELEKQKKLFVLEYDIATMQKTRFCVPGFLMTVMFMGIFADRESAYVAVMGGAFVSLLLYGVISFAIYGDRKKFRDLTRDISAAPKQSGSFMYHPALHDNLSDMLESWWWQGRLTQIMGFVWSPFAIVAFGFAYGMRDGSLLPLGMMFFAMSAAFYYIGKSGMHHVDVVRARLESQKAAHEKKEA